MLHLAQAAMTSDGSAITWSIVLLCGGIAMLVLGGHFLVESAISLATRFGVTPFLIGLTVIAFGTSAPELALNVVAATSGEAGTALAWGNVIGSNMANIGLVLAIACLIRPVFASEVVRRVHIWLLIGATLFLVIIALGWGGVDRISGVILLLCLPICFLVWRRYGSGLEAPPESSTPKWGFSLAIGVLVFGLFMLLSGAKVTEIHAIELAQMAGVSETVIGLTIVAIATSLPESFTAIIASLRRQSELALGTVIGSNVLNILLVLGMTAVVRPVPMPEEDAMLSLVAMIVLTLSMLVFFIRPAVGPNACIAGQHRLTRTWAILALAGWVIVMGLTASGA